MTEKKTPMDLTLSIDPPTNPDTPVALSAASVRSPTAQALPVIPKDAWRPCKPLYTSTVDDRAAVLGRPGTVPGTVTPVGTAVVSTPDIEKLREQYRSVIAQFKVSSSPRYQPIERIGAHGHVLHSTYCNIFVQDVVAAMGAPLPMRVANSMLEELRAGTVKYWHVDTAHNAIAAAQVGRPAVVGWINPTAGPGHIALVRPESSLAPGGIVCVAQAGAQCFQIGPLAQGFSSKRTPLVWAWGE